MTKKFLAIAAFTIASIVGTNAVNAQFRSVPSAVTESFKDKFSKAEDVSWKDKITSFTASYQLKGHNCTSWFDSDGTWKQTETEFSFSELPRKVRKTFADSQYAKWKVERISEIQRSDNSLVYKLYVKGESFIDKKDLYFNENGELIKNSRKLKFD